MPNPFIRETLVRNIARAIEEHRIAADLRHKGLRGLTREVAIRELFLPILPPRFSVGTGVIGDSFGNQSRQSDVVIYCPDLLPARVFGETAMFPIESVLVSIEIKSKLTAKELKASLTAGRLIEDELRFTSGWLDPNTHLPVNSQVLPIYRVLFAFESLKSSDPDEEFDRYIRYVEDGKRSIDALCIVGKGFWAYSSSPAVQGWRHRAATEHYDEVLALLYTITDSLHYTASSRGTPSIGLYIHDYIPPDTSAS